MEKIIMFMKKKIVLTLLLVLVFTGLASSIQAADAPVLKRVLETGQLRVGMTGNQPPMNVKSRTGAFIGLDVDLANMLAESMGVKLTMVPIPFPKLLAALKAGEVDMVMSNMSITSRRTVDVTFIGPYMLSGSSILTKSTNLAAVSSASEINKAEFKIAALENSTSQQFVEKNLAKTTLVRTQNYDEAVDMVLNDEVDLMVADLTICVLTVMRHPDSRLTTLKAPLNMEPIGIAISSEDAQFANLLSNYLNTYKGAGILEKLRTKWLENDAWISSIP
jgi:polar amino acid transport system substrate-binding protein